MTELGRARKEICAADSKHGWDNAMLQTKSCVTLGDHCPCHVHFSWFMECWHDWKECCTCNWESCDQAQALSSWEVRVSSFSHPFHTQLSSWNQFHHLENKGDWVGDAK